MKITLLGTGTSNGVPVLGCQCEVCHSENPKDHRLRTAALVEDGDTRILIDAGPDIREQLLTQPFRKINAVLVTHIHYDHVGGMDDLRPYCHRFNGVDVYAEEKVMAGMRRMLPYCFPPEGMPLYPGAPELSLHKIEPHQILKIGNVEVLPIRVMHDKMPILGYRFRDLAYITDMKTMADSEYQYLQGVKILIINALRWDKPHHSHQLVEDAIRVSRRIGAERTVLIHLTHEIGLHDEANKRLPEGVEFGFDGQMISF